MRISESDVLAVEASYTLWRAVRCLPVTWMSQA